MKRTEETITEGFLTPDEFAKKLGVTPTVVRTWIREGALPAVRLGRLVLVPEDALLRIIDRREGQHE